MYEPYEHLWLVANEPPSSAAMVYPGMLLWGLCGAISAAALTLVVLTLIVLPRAPSWKPSAVALQLAGAWALTSFVVAALYFLWGLWPF